MPPVDRRWEFAVRSPGEFRVVRTECGPLEMWVLGVPADQGPADAAAWLRDVAEVAREGAAQTSGTLPIPRVLYHAVSGLLFAHTDAWGRGRQPCTIAFSCEGDEVGVGWVGPVAAEVWIDGRRESARLVTVRDAQGRDAFAWSAGRDHDLRVVLRWPASVDEPEPFVIELESRWAGREDPEFAWFARPAATAGWVQADPASAAEPAGTARPEPEPVVPTEFADASATAGDMPRAESPSLAWSRADEPAGVASGGPGDLSGIADPDLEPEPAMDSTPDLEGEPAGTVADPTERADVVATGEPSHADADAPTAFAAADDTAGASAGMDPARPSSGIARWLQRSFGWLGRRADGASGHEPPTRDPDHAAGEWVATLTSPPPADEGAGRSPDSGADLGGRAIGGAEVALRTDDGQDERDATPFGDTPEEGDSGSTVPGPPLPGGEQSREDELAASAAALAAMLGESLASVAGTSREGPPLQDDFGRAWRRTLDEGSEMIPPSPEPLKLTERTAPIASQRAPVEAHPVALEITGSRAEMPGPEPVVARPPAILVEPPSSLRADEPFRPLGATIDEMQALVPSTLITESPPAGAEPVPVAAEPPPAEPPAESRASRLPSWLRMPVEAPAPETPSDPREIALEPRPPFDDRSLSRVSPTEELPVVEVAVTASVTEIGMPHEPEGTDEASPRPLGEAAEDASAPPPRRRVPALHPDWPTEVRLEKPKPSPSRAPWLWLGAIIVVLFGAGWLVGMLQEPAAPGQRPGGPLGALLGALGVRGPSFTLDVKSVPEGAWILVDGKPTEQRTPAAIPLAPGAHRVTLSFGQWGEATFPVEGAKDETVPLDAAMWGSLELFAPEPGSVIAVSVDGKPRGFAPIRVDSLAPGPHQVRYSGPGIVSWGQTVEIGVGEEKELVTRAITSPATGLLMVRAQLAEGGGAQDLAGARVWIDGQPRGATPLTLELPRGPHSIRVAWQSETPAVQVIDLPGGNQRFATFQFGSGDEHPAVRVTPPARVAADGSTVINATVDGIAPGEVREMWLHVEGEDHGWRRYPMTRLADVLSAVGAVPFPVAAFGSAAETRWYASISTQHGDEYFTEIATVRLEGRPAR